MSEDFEERWVAHCHAMAHATYAIADRCDDADMLARYVDLAARWLRMAETPVSRGGDAAA